MAKLSEKTSIENADPGYLTMIILKCIAKLIRKYRK